MSFLNQLIKVVNTGQTRSVILCGDIYDLFFDGSKYVPLVDLIKARCKADPSGQQKGITQVLLRNNNPVEVVGDDRLLELEKIWAEMHDDGKTLKERLAETNGNSVYALELLRQLTECSRRLHAKTKNNLLIVVESADMLMPECEVSRMAPHDRRRVAIVQDWFCDPDFLDSHDTVILLSESRSNIHGRVSKLPQVLSVEIPYPDAGQRRQFIEWMRDNRKTDVDGPAFSSDLSLLTAGLSMHAIRQLVLSGEITHDAVSAKVEEFIVSQLGEGVVEFKRPSHKMDNVRGFRRVKEFFMGQLLTAIKADGDASISGAAIAGPIGGGKTFICEALAAELGVPVIVLKNIRSKWYGETDSIFERLRRVLESFNKIVIFVDEADTMFGDVQSDQDTERRLTGKIQAMMSDPRLKGRVIWLLMTARIHRLSPDIRRPGRMDLIIPILDPEDEDRDDFINWAFEGLFNDQTNKELMYKATIGWSAASFAALRSRIKLEKPSSLDEAIRIANDIVSPDIEDVRLYQTLQAKVNCTRRVLLVPDKMEQIDFKRMKESWKEHIVKLESRGIR